MTTPKRPQDSLGIGTGDWRYDAGLEDGMRPGTGRRAMENLARLIVFDTIMSRCRDADLSIAVHSSCRLSPQVLNLKTGEMYVLGIAK
jgi:hypothetical protein